MQLNLESLFFNVFGRRYEDMDIEPLANMCSEVLQKVTGNLQDLQVVNDDGQVVKEKILSIGTTEKRINISGGSSYEPIVGYSRAVIVGNTLYISGTTASSTGGPLHPDAGLQTKETLLIIRKVLEENGSCIEDVVRTRMFVVDIGINGKAVGEAHGNVFSHIRPVSSMIGVAGLIDTRMLVEIECEAIIGCGKYNKTRI